MRVTLGEGTGVKVGEGSGVAVGGGVDHSVAVDVAVGGDVVVRVGAGLGGAGVADPHAVRLASTTHIMPATRARFKLRVSGSIGTTL